MKTVLLPVKEFSSSKERLSPALNSQERSELSRVMLNDVLIAISRSESTQRVLVITASTEVKTLTSKFGFEVVDEPIVAGHSTAVNQATNDLKETASLLVCLAADLPTLQGLDIDTVMSSDHNGLTLVPSRDHTGTNGVLMRPGCRIEMSYGQNSLVRHLTTAKANELPVEILDIPGIGFDVDTPTDLCDVLDILPSESQTSQYLCTTGLGNSIRSLL